MSSLDEKELELLAKAKNAPPPSVNITSNPPIKKLNKQSWRDVAKEVGLSARTFPYPKLHDFEKSVLPSVTTLHTQFSCEICPYCNHPIISALLHEYHIKSCLERVNEENSKSQSSKDVTLTSETDVAIKKEEPKSATEASSTTSSTTEGTAPIRRKRKQNREDDGGPNKKSKSTGTKTKEPKKPGKPRQPKKEKTTKEKPSVTYNPDRNCGVLLPNGHPCMRSLTCKQHPMGAKRSVIGRSAPYDVLLSNYHRQHQLKQAQLTASAAQAAQIESDQQQELEAQQNPEREISQVLEGVGLSICAPLAVNETMTSTALRTQRFRMREMLSMALMPRRLPSTGNLLYGRSYSFKEDNPDVLYNMRSQAVQQAYLLRQRWLQKQKQQQLLEQMKKAEASK